MSEMCGLVLGSGLGKIAEAVDIDERVSFAAAGLPVSSVPGHRGEFLCGTLNGAPVVVMCGRVHLYEGHDAKTVTAGVRWMAQRGVTSLILTNAAGSLRQSMPPGSWMRIADHINFTGCSPLEGGPNFIDMSTVYETDEGAELTALAGQHGWQLHEGVYVGLRGPQYETPAEVRMLQTLGGDAVGMSTVLEAIEARRLSMKVLGVSCLTNYAAGMTAAPLNHQEVVERGRIAADKMVRLLSQWIAR